jgi:hypothetical protein
VEVRLEPENGSKLAGTALLEPGKTGSIDVVLSVEGALDGMHAHIHNVTCVGYRTTKGFDAQLATVANTLADFSGGSSNTNVVILEDGGLRARTTGRYSINVHEPDAPYDTVLCGDIPKR